jgi:5-hydroxyisourate hydrolase
MPGMSIHVVDVSRGVVAAGMRVEVFATTPARHALAEGRIGVTGLLEHPALADTLTAAEYETVFYVADYYRSVGLSLPVPPFLTVVTYRFGLADPKQHYHLPFKCTPWGYSCFRGGE